jgi:UDP-N-acetylglucosamine transferase subunit ALG13
MMIFVTIGTQEPFDRLIEAIDLIALEMKEIEFVAQTFRGEYEPKNMKATEFLTPAEFDAYFKKADLVVSHAGMGTIITALVNQKPLVVMPRQLQLKEHRSDHQLATAKNFEKSKGLVVAYDAADLKNKVQLLINNPVLVEKIGDYANQELLIDLKNFINLKKD